MENEFDGLPNVATTEVSSELVPQSVVKVEAPVAAKTSETEKDKTECGHHVADYRLSLAAMLMQSVISNRNQRDYVEGAAKVALAYADELIAAAKLKPNK